MVTRELAQKAIDEIREICNRYGIVLVGVCDSECLPGEIFIRDAAEELQPWERDPSLVEQIDNRAKFWHTGDWYVTGIGDLTEGTK